MYISTQYDGGKRVPHVRYFSVTFGLKLRKLQRSPQILSRDATRSAGIVVAPSILVRFSFRLLHCNEMACPYLSLCRSLRKDSQKKYDISSDILPKWQ